MTSPDTLTIERFTTEYQAVEDRIRYLVSAKTGESQTLWLTRRLINKLLPALFDLLKEETAGSAMSDDLQAFSQDKARQSIKNEPPVRANNDSEDWLVTHVDLTPSKEVVKLVFYDENDHRVALSLPRHNLRQWLSILRELYNRAQWSENFWPDWLEPLGQTDSSPKQQIH